MYLQLMLLIKLHYRNSNQCPLFQQQIQCIVCLDHRRDLYRQSILHNRFVHRHNLQVHKCQDLQRIF